MTWLFLISNLISMIFLAYILTEYYLVFSKKLLIPRWAYALILTAYITVGTLVNMYLDIKPLAISIIFVTTIGVAFAFEMPLTKKLLSAIVIYILSSVFEILTTLILSLILGASPEQALASPPVYFVAAVLAKIMLLIVVKILSFKMNGISKSTDRASIIISLVLAVITFAIMAFVSMELRATNETYIVVFGIIVVVMLVISDILILYLFTRMSKMMETEHIATMQKTQLENEREYYSTLYARQTTEDKTLHDLKHKAFALDAMLDDDIAKAREIIHSITETLDATSQEKVTGNISIDALLLKKKQECQNSKIDIHIHSYIGNLEAYDTVDICIILGNLLDNAIEGTIRLDENRSVCVMLKQDSSGVVIKVENTFNNDTNLTERTTKSDHIHHGYGITNVKAVVEKYNGYYDTLIEGDKYTAMVYLGNE